MELKACCKERFEPVVQAIRKLQKEKEGLDEPLILNLGVVVITFGLSIKITMAGILGVAAALVIYKAL